MKQQAKHISILRLNFGVVISVFNHVIHLSLFMATHNLLAFWDDNSLNFFCPLQCHVKRIFLWTCFERQQQIFSEHLRSSHRRCFVSKGVLRNFAKLTGKHLAPKASNFIKKETLAQVFSCEFC